MKRFAVLSILFCFFVGSTTCFKFLTTVPDHFGEVEVGSNMNLKLEGTNNSGSFFDNDSLEVASNCSNMVVSNTSNSKISLEDSSLESSFCVNLVMTGTRTKTVLASNVNVKLEGMDSEWIVASSMNLEIVGNESSVNCGNDSNVKISGNRNEIVSMGNSNLEISGNGNNVTVTGTQNHLLRLAKNTEEGEELVNIFEISRGSGKLSHSSDTQALSDSTTSEDQAVTTNNFKFTVDYVGHATISGKAYSLGDDDDDDMMMIQFVLEEKSPATFEISLQVQEELQQQPEPIISVETVNPSELIISIKKNDVKGKLKLKGKLVNSAADEGTNNNNNNIFVVEMGVK